MIQVKDSPHTQPDISRVTPVYVPKNGTRSYVVSATFINERGRYQSVPAIWNDVEKRWEYASSGCKIPHEIVETEALPETVIHYPL